MSSSASSGRCRSGRSSGASASPTPTGSTSRPTDARAPASGIERILHVLRLRPPSISVQNGGTPCLSASRSECKRSSGDHVRRVKLLLTISPRRHEIRANNFTGALVLADKTIGRDIRALRKARGLTLADLARRLDRSVGWMSQVERDISIPSAAELGALASELGVAIATLRHAVPVAEAEAGVVVRATARRPVGHRAAGLAEELLSPDLTDDFEVVHSTFAPGARRKTAVTRPTQELGYIVSGTLDITIGTTTHTLGPGDSFRIRGEPFRWANPSSEPCVAIWVIAPPVY
ncbi:MAG: helix-turn-helix transcriptional regulator [Silicimonas sp.]|nr:helix-turn-helix transcriptional regulator [Silicimonas sp.]